MPLPVLDGALPPPPAGLPAPCSLFLDFDGTLVTIADRPDLVAVDPGLPDLIRSLAEQLEGRLAVISGRPVAEILAFLGDLDVPISGSHGLEMRLHAGAVAAPAPPAALSDFLAQAELLALEWPGVLVERKPFGVALHYRQAPDAEIACRELAERLSDGPDLRLQPGKMVVEVLMSGADKGTALAQLMSAAPFSGTTPICLGDDHTDEPAFRAAEKFGGFGILVGEARESAARFLLRDVRSVHQWLDQLRPGSQAGPKPGTNE